MLNRPLSALKRVVPLTWAVGLAFSFAGAAVAEIVTVTTTDGRTLQGELVRQTTETITLQIAGINTPLAMSEVESVVTRQSIDEIYRERKAEIDPENFQQGYDLAYFLFENREFEKAQDELADLAQRFPNQERIAQLRTVIEQRLRLMSEPPASQLTVSARERQDNARPSARAYEELLLTPEQVSMIRLWELPADLTASQPRVVIPRDTLVEFLDAYRDVDRVPKGRAGQRAFLAQKGYEQLDLMFSLRARVFYKDVLVRDDPETLVPFRRTINPVYVTRYFRRHFGTGQIPDFHLLGRIPNDAREAYTNFYILSESDIDGVALINRVRPEESLLLQWGLPRAAAIYPAPEVEGWRPFFAAGLDDPRFREYVAWIDSLYSTKSNYGINYVIPTADDLEAFSGR